MHKTHYDDEITKSSPHESTVSANIPFAMAISQPKPSAQIGPSLWLGHGGHTRERFRIDSLFPFGRGWDVTRKPSMASNLQSTLCLAGQRAEREVHIRSGSPRCAIPP
jgi:hypothetical protein